MKLKKQKYNFENLDQFLSIIMDTELADLYYPSGKFLEKELEEAKNIDEIYLIKDEDINEDIGVLWFNKKGIFHAFPYLHLIVVKKEFQAKGYGRALLELFEKEALEDNGKSLIKNKVFLLVNEKNEKATKLYVGQGYKKQGELKGLYRKELKEYLMGKELKRYEGSI
ncbi:GNAT family N-acetyltransferase [Lachnospira pectinoschiza]|uniref:Acetyltransferase (GNAT) family protein n=1 Tax=Lachnospira pectinoschiza TaxID=28052 RepID=A0A1G9T9S3_9FIRM|nr:GNAT family N-acetyltransferase [Lachnospira pectinoschiza]SDM44396.1 Acetyltransferase (GNAT) family protein [Lachnospira pectinoschiza]